MICIHFYSNSINLAWSYHPRELRPLQMGLHDISNAFFLWPKSTDRKRGFSITADSMVWKYKRVIFECLRNQFENYPFAFQTIESALLSLPLRFGVLYLFTLQSFHLLYLVDLLWQLNLFQRIIKLLILNFFAADEFLWILQIWITCEIITCNCFKNSQKSQ